MSNSPDDNPDDFEVLIGWNENQEYYRTALKRVADIGLGPWEISILDAIWFDYGQVRDKQVLASTSFGRYFNQNSGKAYEAIEKCFANRWIQFLTKEFVDRMLHELTDGGYLMPRGLIGHHRQCESSVGLISFTEEGAAVYHRWLDFDPATEGHWCIGDESEGFCAAYGTTLEACEFPVNESVEQVIEREPAMEIGRWCDRWWNRFQQGFRIRYRTIEG